MTFVHQLSEPRVVGDSQCQGGLFRSPDFPNNVPRSSVNHLVHACFQSCSHNSSLIINFLSPQLHFKPASSSLVAVLRLGFFMMRAASSHCRLRTGYSLVPRSWCTFELVTRMATFGSSNGTNSASSVLFIFN